MATLAATPTSRAGVNLTTAAVAADAGGADKWPGSGQEMLLISNGSGGSYTATLPIAATPDGQEVASRTVIVPTLDYMLIGPFPVGTYNDGQGNVNVQHSATASIKILILKLGN